MKTAQLKYPDWVYNAFPHLFIVLGLLLIAPVSNVLTVLCGVGLMGGGAFVWRRRESYRQAFAHSNGLITLPDWSAAGTPAPGHVQISWRSSLECGHPVIDAQHRRLFGLCSQIVNAVSTNKPRADTLALMGKLIDHMRVHYLTEEILLTRMKRAGVDQHRSGHADLLARASALSERFQAGEAPARELVHFVTYDIIVDDLLKEDTKFASEAKPVAVAVKKPAKPRPSSDFNVKDELGGPVTVPGESGKMIWDGGLAHAEKRADRASLHSSLEQDFQSSDRPESVFHDSK